MSQKTQPVVKQLKEKTFTHIVKTAIKQGDTLNERFEESGDLQVVKASQQSYRTAIQASKAQLMYKKMTGNSVELNYLKD